MIASPEQLRALFPHAIAGYLDPLGNGRMMAEHGLNEPLAFCHCLAQSGVEAGRFTLREENGNYSAERLLQIFPKYFTPAQAKAYAHKPQAILSRAYANRMGNGSEASGDGWKFRGRGPFSTTGKDNYAATGKRLGLDLVARPELLGDDFGIGWKAAMFEWSALDLGRVARELGPTHEAVLKIARGINLGNVNSGAQPNGLAERKALFDTIWKALGTGAVPRLDPAADGVLEEGESGAGVQQLQEALARLGYAVGEPDGVFGPRTTAAVAVLQMREGLGGVSGKYQIAWNEKLAAARPFDNAARQEATATDLAAKGDNVVGTLLWFRRAMVAAGTYLGLDTAADKAGLQLPENLVQLRGVIEPLSGTLQWLAATKWALLLALCIGAGWLASSAIRQLVERHKNFGVKTP